MQPSEAWHVWGMDVDKVVSTEFWGEVTSPLIYEPSTAVFHPSGLYSEQIFGQIGTAERMSKLGYINLNCDILSPLAYLNITNICGWYSDIMSGKAYATYSSKERCFISAKPDDPGAGTGYNFFISKVYDLAFERNNSVSRNNKITTIEKMIKEKTLTITKFPVCPAGWRDLKVDQNGRTSTEEINKSYLALLMVAIETGKNINDPLFKSFFDGIKYNMQLKVLEIFNHWKSFYDGKTGFGQAHYAKRNLALGTRGVITAATLEAESPDDPGYIKQDETHAGLYQIAKAFAPAVVHQLNLLFTSQIYTQGSINVPAVDKDTLDVKYVEVSPSEITYALSSESKYDLINSLKNVDAREDPVIITDKNEKTHWLWMVYDLDTDLYLFRNKDDLEKMLSQNRSPVDKVELVTHVRHLDRIDALGLTSDEYVIIASGALIAHGREKINNDLDVIVTPEAFTRIHDRLRTTDKEGIFTDETGVLDIAFKSEIVNWEAAYYYSELIGGYRFLTIEGSKMLYRKMVEKFNLPKHIETLKWLNELDHSVKIDVSKIRPLTKFEMIYIATYAATHDKYATITRFPVTGYGSIYPSKVSIITTVPNRQVTIRSQYNPDQAVVLPHYPVLDKKIYFDSISVHPSKTAGLVADHDGDKISLNGIISKEANDEAKKHVDSPAYMVSPSGQFYDSLDRPATSYVIHALSMDPF